jgi:peptidoglycan hydrolase-like protein with peptidoglycan-binding domain
VAIFDMDQTETVSVYVDGALQTRTSFPHTADNSAYNFGNLPLYLMSRAGASLFVPGKMQHFAIYSDLSADKIANHYSNAFNPQSDSTNSGGSSASSRVRNLIQMGNLSLADEVASQHNVPIIVENVVPIDTVCPVGHMFSAVTGKACTSHDVNLPSNVEPLSTAPAVQPPVKTEPSCYVVNTIGVGWHGPEVKCLQSFLNINPDGIFGQKTKSAVMSFQSSKGLKSDGIVGPRTRALVNQ